MPADNETPQPAPCGDSRDASLDLDAIMARADAATPGPWASYEDWVPDEPKFAAVDAINANIYTNELVCKDTGYNHPQAMADAAFIAAARTDVPDLAAEVERLRAAERRASEAESAVLHAIACGECAMEANGCADLNIMFPRLRNLTDAPRPTSEPRVGDSPPAMLGEERGSEPVNEMEKGGESPRISIVEREPITEALAVEVAVNRVNPQESAPFRAVPMDAERIAALRAALAVWNANDFTLDAPPGMGRGDVSLALRAILRDAGADE